MADRETKAVRLVADVGGTNTRLALYDPAVDEYRALSVYRNCDHTGLEEIIDPWLQALEEPAPATCCIATAAPPPSGEIIRMINIDWSFSCKELARRFGFEQAAWLNDFQANAYALPHFREDDRVLLHSGKSSTHATLAVMGPGTGLGGATLEWVDGLPHARDSEPGHMGLYSATEEEMKIFALLLPRYGEIHAERLVSGSGLLLLYQALADIHGLSPVAGTPAEVSDSALRGEDDVSVRALETFCGLLGSACGDFVLANGAYGGLYLAGGIVPRILAFLRASQFLHRFKEKGAMRSHLEAVPLYAITADQPGLIGAAHAPL